MTNSIYRTLVRGTLVQESALNVGGSKGESGDPDLPCARDGRGQLTIPGTGLAGALIETAGRIFPDLLDSKQDADSLWNRITGKTRRQKADQAEEKLRQSLWHFWPAHPDDKKAGTEARQGVGIRQATGATAAQARALFDIETIPAGTRWDLFFEIDMSRAGTEASKLESIALLALWEWTQGRCWLGAGAARGLGWMKLENVEVLRLPLTADAVNAWPDNALLLKDALQTLCKHGKHHPNADLRALALTGQPEGFLPKQGRFVYLILDATLAAGVNADGYGRDTLAVSGHAAGALVPLSENLLAPLGMTAKDFREKEYLPDSPVVTTMTPGAEKQRPTLPGSGIRGPLRHRASAWWRGRHRDVVDPNDAGDDRRFEKPVDEVARLFGLAEQSARLLVRDGTLLGDRFRLAWLQHHAEDEFTAGVYGSGKFDRTAVLEGEFSVRLVIEAQCPKDLHDFLDTLRPALRLAELGQVPLGGGKWRGHGWVPWKFTKVGFVVAGDKPTELPLKGVKLFDAIPLVVPPREQS